MTSCSTVDCHCMYSTLPNCLKSSCWTFITMQMIPSCIWVYYLMKHLWPSSVWTRASSTLKPGLEPAARLNLTKTQVMWLGSGLQQLAKVDTDEMSLLASRVHVLDAARKLGVIFDSQLSMSAQVSAVCSTGYYQLRQLRPLVRCLSEDAAKILIQAFIDTRLDYCNSLYFGIADGLMSRLSRYQCHIHTASCFCSLTEAGRLQIFTVIFITSSIFCVFNGLATFVLRVAYTKCDEANCRVDQSPEKNKKIKTAD